MVVRNIWRKLVEGSYKPADWLPSSRLMMALRKAPLVVVDTLPTQDLVSLVENIKSVAAMGQYRQYLMVCLRQDSSVISLEPIINACSALLQEDIGVDSDGFLRRSEQALVIGSGLITDESWRW